jgi:PmbA protein
MLQGVVAIGKDIEVRGSKQVGSVLVERMTIAGN